MKKRAGVALLTVIFIMLAFSVIAGGLVSIFISTSRSVVDDHRYARAYYIAEAGRYFALKHITAFPDWSVNMGFPLGKNFGGGAFVVSVTNATGNSLTINSTGLITVEGKAYTRVVRASVTIAQGSGLPHNFNYALYVGPLGGGATLRVEGSAGIFGDFYYNGPIRLGGSAHQQDGTIYSTSLSVFGSATYASWEAAEPVDMPIWDNGLYDALLAEANNTAPTALNLGWGQTLNLNGETKYYQSISIGWGSTVNGPGTLVATGNPVGSGDILISYGGGIGQNINFIAKRDFIYSGGSSLVNAVKVYVQRYLKVNDNLTVPGGSILYSKSILDEAIEISGNVNANLLAPYGQIYINYGNIKGLLYGNRLRTANSGTIRGAIVCSTTSSIQGSLNIYYDPTYIPPSLLGLSGTGMITGEAAIKIGTWEETN